MVHPVGGVSVDHIRISQAILPSGVFGVGTPPTNHIYCVSDHVIYDSTHDAFVYNTMLAVSPVLVSPILLSLVVPRVEIDEVFPEISVESPSRAVFMAPDTVAKVNICANVIL